MRLLTIVMRTVVTVVVSVRLLSTKMRTVVTIVVCSVCLSCASRDAIWDVDSCTRWGHILSMGRHTVGYICAFTRFSQLLNCGRILTLRASVKEQ